MRRKGARYGVGGVTMWSHGLNKALCCHTSKDTILLGKEGAVVYSVSTYKCKMVDLTSLYTSYYYFIVKYVCRDMLKHSTCKQIPCGKGNLIILYLRNRGQDAMLLVLLYYASC